MERMALVAAMPLLAMRMRCSVRLPPIFFTNSSTNARFLVLINGPMSVSRSSSTDAFCEMASRWLAALCKLPLACRGSNTEYFLAALDSSEATLIATHNRKSSN